MGLLRRERLPPQLQESQVEGAGGRELGSGLEGGALAVVHPVREVGRAAGLGGKPLHRWGK